MLPIAPGHDVNAASFVLPHVFGYNAAIPSDNSLHTTLGGKIVPYASVVSDFGHHLDMLHGNDIISGGNGNDTLVGDDMIVVAPQLSFDTARMAQAEAITRSLLNISAAFADMVHQQYSLLGTRPKHGHHKGQEPLLIDNIYSIGEDRLYGGAGNDVLIGDNSTLIAPSFILPVNLAEKFEMFQKGMTDAGEEIARALIDLIYLEHRMRDTTTQVQHGKHLDKVIEHHADLIMIGKDVISGGDDKDYIVGDSFDARAPTLILTAAEAGTVRDKHHEKGWRDDVHRSKHGDHAKWSKAWGHGGHHHDHLDAVEVGADSIYGGSGADLIWGDSISMHSRTITRATGLSNRDFSNARHQVDKGLDRLVKAANETDFWFDFAGHHGHHRHGHGHHHDNRLDDGDTISGGDGNDIIFGQDGRDVLHGDAGDDWLVGGAEKDTLDGGSGKDKRHKGDNKSGKLSELVDKGTPLIDWSGIDGSFFDATDR
jgi:Ca2+-binding RTX toxin-like protein